MFFINFQFALVYAGDDFFLLLVVGVRTYTHR